MKRHPALRELSSDHHQGLVHARRLVMAAELDNPVAGLQATDIAAAKVAGTQKVARAFLTFWAEHITHHFREEEEVLLPMFARYGDPGHPAVVRVLVEHVHIRRLVYDLQRQLETDQPLPETMRSVGEQLRAHIRHEEDVVFPIIEAAMPEEALQALAAQISGYADHSRTLPAANEPEDEPSC